MTSSALQEEGLPEAAEEGEQSQDESIERSIPGKAYHLQALERANGIIDSVPVDVRMRAVGVMLGLCAITVYEKSSAAPLLR